MLQVVRPEILARLAVVDSFMVKIDFALYREHSLQRALCDAGVDSPGPLVTFKNFPVEGAGKLEVEMMVLKFKPEDPLEVLLADELDEAFEQHQIAKVSLEHGLQVLIEQPRYRLEVIGLPLHTPWRSPAGRHYNLLMAPDSDGKHFIEPIPHVLPWNPDTCLLGARR